MIAAQSPLRVDFPVENSLRQSEDGYSYFVPTLPKNDSLNFGKDRYPLRLPPGAENSDIAIGEVYLGVWRTDAISYAIPVLVQDYTSRAPYFYVDTSASFDFTEAVKYRLNPLDSTVVFELPHPYRENCKHAVQLKTAYYAKEEDRAIAEEHFIDGRVSMFNPTVPSDYWYEERGMNFKFDTFDYANRTYSIGLYDYDADGLFNDEDEDRFLFGVGTDPLDESFGYNGIAYRPGAIFGDGEHNFELVSIDASGSHLLFQPTERSVSATKLRVGNDLSSLLQTTKTPNLRYLSDSLHRDGYTLVDVWGSWCAPCVEAIPHLQALAKRHPRNLKVLGFNHGDTTERMNATSERLGVTWSNLSINNRDAELLGIDSYPTYLLFDGDGTLLTSTNSLERVEQLMK